MKIGRKRRHRPFKNDTFRVDIKTGDNEFPNRKLRRKPFVLKNITTPYVHTNICKISCVPDCNNHIITTTVKLILVI